MPLLNEDDVFNGLEIALCDFNPLYESGTKARLNNSGSSSSSSSSSSKNL